MHFAPIDSFDMLHTVFAGDGFNVSATIVDAMELIFVPSSLKHTALIRRRINATRRSSPVTPGVAVLAPSAVNLDRISPIVSWFNEGTTKESVSLL